ncbi:hypothetical protein C8Q74DRAFT_1214539 [Fomes fomentarius]|nr:hypothetical protein C8Q74DRAFT_1214539 [Fomes fomentarius]
MKPAMSGFNRDMPMSELFLPSHLQLDLSSFGGPLNWEAYQHAIMAILRVKGLDGHLVASSEPASVLIEERSKGWEDDDELCKALITLNVKHDFKNLKWHAEDLARKTASTVWWELGQHVDGARSSQTRPAHVSRVLGVAIALVIGLFFLVVLIVLGLLIGRGIASVIAYTTPPVFYE